VFVVVFKGEGGQEVEWQESRFPGMPNVGEIIRVKISVLSNRKSAWTLR